MSIRCLPKPFSGRFARELGIDKQIQAREEAMMENQENTIDIHDYRCIFGSSKETDCVF